MFEDKRSKRVLLTAHCVLNQNAKIDRCAHYPGMIKEVTTILIEIGVGIVQMPCPEILYLGLDRQVERGAPTTIESEDTRVGQRMVEDRGKTLCREIASDLVYQMEEYRQNGFEIVSLQSVDGHKSARLEVMSRCRRSRFPCNTTGLRPSRHHQHSSGTLPDLRWSVLSESTDRLPVV
jgi:predicted secreted protein